MVRSVYEVHDRVEVIIKTNIQLPDFQGGF